MNADAELEMHALLDKINEQVVELTRQRDHWMRIAKARASEVTRLKEANEEGWAEIQSLRDEVIAAAEKVAR